MNKMSVEGQLPSLPPGYIIGKIALNRVPEDLGSTFVPPPGSW